MRADLDTLLIAVYCAACSFFPAPLPEEKRRRGRPRKISDNELICLMVAQMLLGVPSERRFLPVAAWRLGHLFPVLPSQTTYKERCRQLAPKLVILWRAIAGDLTVRISERQRFNQVARDPYVRLGRLALVE